MSKSILSSTNYGEPLSQELTCSSCRKLFEEPVLLPCSHSVCYSCAAQLLEHATSGKARVFMDHHDTASVCSSDALDADSDKASLLSETDSGVVCGSLQPVGPMLFSNSISSDPIWSVSATSCLHCPVCRMPFRIDQKELKRLPRNKALQNIVHRYAIKDQQVASSSTVSSSSRPKVSCQLCEGEAGQASFVCEQCQVFYCVDCRSNCHPARGPLATHSLLEVGEASELVARLLAAQQQSKPPGLQQEQSKCGQHISENLTLLCLTCKRCICCLCLQDISHSAHDVQPLATMCKTYKAELSKSLTAFSDRLRAATRTLAKLKSKRQVLQHKYQNVESAVISQCDQLQQAIEQQKTMLLQELASNQQSKLRLYDEKIHEDFRKQQDATGLVQFCIEMMKESDAISFLQVVNGLLHRLCATESSYGNTTAGIAEMDQDLPEIAEDCGWLNTDSILQAISKLRFVTVSASPLIVEEQCICTSSSISVVWKFPSSVAANFAVEYCRACSAVQLQVFCGTKTTCLLDGLEPNSSYTVRVTAINSSGQKTCSQSVTLATYSLSHDAIQRPFQFDPRMHHEDIVLLNNDTSITCSSFEYRAALVGVPLSSGEHEWEVVVERLDADCDIFVGIAQFDLQKDQMLGKDAKGWSMYIDNKRSWFLHAQTHKDRLPGGVSVGSVIGVRFNCNTGALSFFVNRKQRGPDVAFRNLPIDVYYPAVSLNRSAQISARRSMGNAARFELDLDTSDKDEESEFL